MELLIMLLWLGCVKQAEEVNFIPTSIETELTAVLPQRSDVYEYFDSPECMKTLLKEGSQIFKTREDDKYYVVWIDRKWTMRMNQFKTYEEAVQFMHEHP